MAKDAAYYEAEKKIAKALQSSATELDLHNAKISELPEIIGELTSLQSLILRDNQLKALPESIGQLIQLQSLNVSGNKLTSLPQSLGQLQRLRSLNISYNSLPTIPRQLRQLSQLQSLEIDGLKLTALPEWLGQLTQLTNLDVSYNKLTTLPDSLRHLTQLTDLDLSSNQLTILPDSLSKLTQLTELYLSYNQLTALPDSLSQLTQLKKLNLSSIQLTTLPNSLGQLTQLTNLDISNNELTTLPDSLGDLTQLTSLNLSSNQLTALPEWIDRLGKIRNLSIWSNRLTSLPDSLCNLLLLKDLAIVGNKITSLPISFGNLRNLTFFNAQDNKLNSLPASFSNLRALETLVLGWATTTNKEHPGNPIVKLPEFIGDLEKIKSLYLNDCMLSDLPTSLIKLINLETILLDNNPLNPALQSAYDQGLDAVKAYLRAKAESGEITLNEAKLILVGEGGVGKTSLISALRGDEWVENRKSTEGVDVDIKSLLVNDETTGKEITLNGWDFGGQNIYRHTHQLFFTSPAIYLVVWNPRRGPEQCAVNEWCKMIKHRAYDESRHEERPRILVVATNGGPKERLDHIDEQALLDEFGDLICGFYHVDSKPDESGICYQLDELKQAIAREAASISSVGRNVPVSWKNVLEAVRRRSERDPYISYERFEALCSRQKVDRELAALYAIILNELGHLIYYRNDESLKDTVILKPDYLSKAISFVLEDKTAKDAHGLIEHSHFSEIWFNPARPESERYPKDLHPIFLRLLERFDLSYQVVMPDDGASPTSLVAQLVPGIRPEGWETDWGQLRPGDVERAQVCRILDAETGRTAEAEGLMYRLIVRLHRYSLGKNNYFKSRHWKTGLLLEDGYNGRAFIEEIGGDLSVTVRAAYPERFLSHLCSEIQWLVDHFWKGLDAKLFVPCLTEKCKGLLEIDEIMDFKNAGMPKVRCSVCAKFHEIDSLMATMQPKPEWSEAVAQMRSEHQHILRAQEIGFDSLSTQLRVLMSQADEQYEELLAWLSDPAKDGPRLFSFEPVNRSRFDPATWTHETFRLTLWCEHARVPLPYLDGKDSKQGIYEIDLTREWFKKAAPVLKFITTTASLILPIASAGIKLPFFNDAFKSVESQLDFSKEVIEASLSGFEKTTDFLAQSGESGISKGIRADDSALRELHTFLKTKDPGFGGLKRVQDKRRQFLWVHERFAGEY